LYGLLEPDRDRHHHYDGRDATRQGKTDIQSSAQAAEALKPITGPLAELVFALGIAGTGLLAISVLAGSTAYAIGEGRHWKSVDGFQDGPFFRPPGRAD
jgi:hypothetical protein